MQENQTYILSFGDCILGDDVLLSAMFLCIAFHSFSVPFVSLNPIKK